MRVLSALVLFCLMQATLIAAPATAQACTEADGTEACGCLFSQRECDLEIEVGIREGGESSEDRSIVVREVSVIHVYRRVGGFDVNFNVYPECPPESDLGSLIEITVTRDENGVETDRTERLVRWVCLASDRDVEVPTVDRAWDATPLPNVSIDTSPSDFGVTGLDIWLWYGGATEAGPVSVSAGTASGSPVTVSAWAEIVGFCWVMDDPRISPPPAEPGESRFCTTSPSYTYESATPGDNSEDGAAATHIYDTTGTYTVTVEVLWEGWFDFAGTTYSLGRQVRRASQPYEVYEVRGALTG